MMYFRKMFVRFILIAFLVAPFILLTQGTCTAEVPKKGGTYTVAIESKISNLDPQYSGGPNQRIWATFYENLITKDIEGNIQPALATDWEWVDKRHIKFTLRKGIKFTTGRKLDADAVVASFQRALNPEDPHQFFGFTKWIKSVRKEGEYTVIIETDRDYPMATDYLCSTESGVIVDAKAAKEWGDLKTRDAGTGPFTLDEWVPGQYVRLKRNEGYWGKKPNIDYVVFRYIPEPAAQVLALEKGEIDGIFRCPPAMVPRLEKNPDVNVLKYPYRRKVTIEMNFLKPILRDHAKIRKAISLAIDTVSITKNIVGIKAIPADSVVTDQAFGYYGYGFPEYNSQIAKLLLEEEGWVDADGDGIRDKDGKPFEITYVTDIRRDYRNRDVAVAVQSYLKEVGIKVNLQLVERAPFVDIVVNKGEHDMCTQGWSNQSGEASWDTYLRLHSDSQDLGTWGTPRTRRAEIDALIKHAMGVYDREEQKVWWEIVQRKIYNETLIIPLYFVRQLTALRTRVHNYPKVPHEYWQYRYINVWVE